MPHNPKILQCVFAAALCASPARAQSLDTEWILQQHSDTNGNVTVYVSRDAVKIVSLDWGYQLLAKAPSWTIHCFRPKEKIEWLCNLAHFNGTMLVSPVYGGEANKDRVHPFEHGVMQGLHFTNYAKSRQSQSKLFLANDIDVSAEAANFICRFSNSPNAGKVPLYWGAFKERSAGESSKGSDGWIGRMDFAEDKRSGLVAALATKSWKKQPFNPLDFEYPHAYKVVSKLNQITYSDTQRQTINEMFDDMGMASDGAHKK